MIRANQIDLDADKKIALAKKFTQKTPEKEMKRLMRRDDTYLPGTPERIAIYRKRYQSHIVLNSGERFPENFRHVISGKPGDIIYMPKKNMQKIDHQHFKRLKTSQDFILRILSESS